LQQPNEPRHQPHSHPRPDPARSEKKLLNTINHRAYTEGGCRFPIMEALPAASASGGSDGKHLAQPEAPRKVKARIQAAEEKIQVLVRARKRKPRLAGSRAAESAPPASPAIAYGGSAQPGSPPLPSLPLPLPPPKINEALSDRPGSGPGEALDFALRQEQDQASAGGGMLVWRPHKRMARSGQHRVRDA
jgi:hypothetical protein